MISIWRIALLAGFTLLLVFLWDFPELRPLKVFVVYLHEISHGIGALITGGEVEAIFVSWDESGFTKTRGGNFLTMASAGYIGSILFGSVMLFSGLKDKMSRFVSIVMGMTMLFFTMAYPEKLEILIMVSGIAWGALFIICGVILHNINRYVLFFMGGLTSLYGFYDLGDFFRGNISKPMPELSPDII